MWAPGSLLATEILQNHGGNSKASRSTPIVAIQLHDADAEAESIALMETKRTDRQSPLGADRPNGGLGIAYADLSSAEPASPRRLYTPTVDEQGNAAHPPPLNVQSKLQASLGRSAPIGNGEGPSPSLLQSPKPQSSERSRTLQIRHHDSPSTSSLDSSEDEFESVQNSLTTPLETSDNPFDFMRRTTSNTYSEGGDNTPRRRASPMPPTMSRQSTLQLQRSSLETARPSPAMQDLNLDDEEAGMGVEDGYLNGGTDSTRTADAAGAIMGIANMCVMSFCN